MYCVCVSFGRRRRRRQIEGDQGCLCMCDVGRRQRQRATKRFEWFLMDGETDHSGETEHSPGVETLVRNKFTLKAWDFPRMLPDDRVIAPALARVLQSVRLE